MEVKCQVYLTTNASVALGYFWAFSCLCGYHKRRKQQQATATASPAKSCHIWAKTKVKQSEMVITTVGFVGLFLELSFGSAVQQHVTSSETISYNRKKTHLGEKKSQKRLEMEAKRHEMYCSSARF